MGIKKRRQQIEEIFLQKDINLAVKKAKAKEERRRKAQRFLGKPLFKPKRRRRARVSVRGGIKSLLDVI